MGPRFAVRFGWHLRRPTVGRGLVAAWIIAIVFSVIAAFSFAVDQTLTLSAARQGHIEFGSTLIREMVHRLSPMPPLRTLTGAPAAHPGPPLNRP